MKQPEINTLILGQTKVGKSSLINYLYGAEVVRTGTGKSTKPEAVRTDKGESSTERDDFPKISIPSPFNSDVKINIFDSWGLESNKAEDWEALIDEKLNAKLSFDEMVYAIVYCSSYANDGVQDFEIKMLKKLLSKKYKVTIALTKADNSGFETKKTVFREKFAKELPEYRGDYSVVDICAEPIKKLGQSTVSGTFGKEELLEELEKDFLTNFVNVVFTRWTEWKDESIDKLEDFRKRSVSRIGEFKGGFFDSNRDKAKQIADDLNKELKDISNDIQEKNKSAIVDLKAWYEQTEGSFYYKGPIIIGEPPFYMREIFKVLIFVYTFGIFDKLNFKEQNDLKIELIKGIHEAVRKVENEIREKYRVVENLRADLKRSQMEQNA
jgi:GTP-binding protein EngB required for normal cell division